MSKRLTILIPFAVIILGIFLFFRWDSSVLWNISNQGSWLLPLVAVSSLIDSINPCAFSILLLTIAFLFTLGRSRQHILGIGLVYIAGIFAVYMLIGLGILQTLHIFNTPHFMAKVGALALIIFGAVNLINEFFPKFPIKLKIPHAAHSRMASLMEKATMPTAFILGAFVGLCEFPCTGGPYLMVLGLLHDNATFWSGLGYLILYNAIFVLPLVVILSIASDQRLLEKAQAWQNSEKSSMRLWGGAAMVLLGALIYLM